MSATAASATGRRAVTARQEVRGTLETLTALRVGGWGPSANADLVAARDGLGRLVIPGTSLAGALRAWLGTVPGSGGGALFSPAELGKVFGNLTPRSQDGEVCRIRVDDAVASPGTTVAIRDGVGIDRGTGSAAAGVLYQHEVIPAGATFAVRITAEQAAGDRERVGEALDLLLRAAAAGQVVVGAARTRGLGVVRLTSARRLRVDLADRDQVLAWLCGQAAPVPEPPVEGAAADGCLGIEITWSAVTPVMVRASTVNEPDPDSGRAVDTVPLRTTRPGHDGKTALLLPGSSVKGVLRSHAERIVRTLRGIGDLPGPWLDQVNDDRLEPVGMLFGQAGNRPGRGTGSGRQQSGDGLGDDGAVPGEEARADADSRVADSGRRGALAVHDCHGTAVQERVVTHVAVDRWTGGAAENLLFSVQEPAAAEWEPLRLSLDTRRVLAADGDGTRELALLLLVLRDLADGWLAVGFGGTRGRGTIEVSQVTFSGQDLPGPWAALSGRTLADLASDPPAVVRAAFAAWQQAVTA